MKCRHCNTSLNLLFADLGSAPPSNAYLTAENLHRPEKWFPLRVYACERCKLVQTEDFAERETMFSDDYAYFSSFSTTWLAHAKSYVDEVITRFRLGANSRVVEVAANDGYLLQYVQARGIPCLGIEPTASTATAARDKGIDVVEDFFGCALAKKLVDQGLQADLLVANNVLAHVPDINDFLGGFTLLLKANGVVTFEFPHLMRLVAEHQFDTIYHEHYSYLSLIAVNTIFAVNGLTVFDVDELTTHGGSLRVYAQQTASGSNLPSERVEAMLNAERSAGLEDPAYYLGFQDAASRVKNDFLYFLLNSHRLGKTVVGYGAAAKGNTLMNYAGIRPDLMAYVVDRNPAKQGKFMPGSRIPIVGEDILMAMKPDYIVILPWNIKNEVMQQLAYVKDWGGRFVTTVPHLDIV